MRLINIILAIVLAGLVGVTAWQVITAEVANMNFQEDIRDLAAGAGSRVGFVAPGSDAEMARTVCAKAKEHGIDLAPGQVTVRRTGTGLDSKLYLGVDYTTPINLGIVSWGLHFTPASDK